MTDRMTDEQIDALCEALPTIAGMVQIKCSRDAASTIRLALTAIRQLQSDARRWKATSDDHFRNAERLAKRIATPPETER